MTQNVTDVDEFTATVSYPSPGESITAASQLLPVQALANRTRNNFNAVTAHGIRLTTLEGIVNKATPASQQRILPLESGFGRQPSDSTHEWHFVAVDGSNQTQYWKSLAAGGRLVFPVELDAQSVITQVRAKVTPSAPETMTLKLIKYTPSIGSATAPASTQIGTQNSDGTASAQTITLGSLSESVLNSGSRYFVELQANTTVASICYGMDVTYDEVGPRNY